MTPLDYDTAYSAGVRNLLIEAAAHRRSKRHHHLGIGLTLVAGLTVLGTGGAFAANLLLPGADIVSDTGTPHSVTGTGPKAIDLGRVPANTNSLETTLTCLRAGTLTWPDGASQTCTATDVGTGSTASLPWTSNDSTFRLGATAGMKWRLTYTFSHRRPTSLATNAAGQTYGIDSANGHPDLIAAEATNGRRGYISAKDEAAASCGDVHTPAEAIECDRETAGKTITIPVYEADGHTKIGVFRIGD